MKRFNRIYNAETGIRSLPPEIMNIIDEYARFTFGMGIDSLPPEIINTIILGFLGEDPKYKTYLLDITDNITVNDIIGDNPTTINEMLIVAIQNDHAKAVEKLLEAGADPNYEIRIRNPGFSDDDDIMTNDYDSDDNYTTKTALMMAAENGYVEVVQELINHGADVKKIINDVWDRPYSALRYAAENHHEPVARLLLSHGASVHYSDYEGDYARDTNYRPIIHPGPLPPPGENWSDGDSGNWYDGGGGNWSDGGGGENWT